jgi:hypothetical protein
MSTGASGGDDVAGDRAVARVLLEAGMGEDAGLSHEAHATMALVLAEDRDLRRSLADAGERAVTAIIAAATRSPVLQEAMRTTLREQMDALGLDTAPPLERLLIQEVGVSYVQLNCARADYEAIQARSSSVRERIFWEHRLTGAQRRYCRACETLAKIRKLNLTIQVNINQGGQQVNLA